MQINPVQQGPGNFLQITCDPLRRTATLFLIVAMVPTRARVHGRNQLKSGREGHPVISPRDGNIARFQGFTQALQYMALELGQLVQKQHPDMGQCHLAGGQVTATAHHGYAAGTVMRRPERR